MKPSPKTISSGMLLLLLSMMHLGWADNWQELRAAAAKLTSLQANFVQEKHMKILARPIVSKGRFFYRQPNAIRWEYETPLQSVLVTSNGDIKHFVRAEDGMSETSGQNVQSMQFVMQEIGNWMQGRFDESQVFTATLGKDRKIVLTPKHKAMSRFIQEIEISLSARPGVIDQVVIRDSASSYTQLSFTDVVSNQPLDDALFEGL